MTLIRLIVNLSRNFRVWDRTSQTALLLALALLALVGGFALFGAAESRLYAIIGCAGLLIVTQVIILWGNRGMVTPYTQAQRLFMAGDFAAARDLLEALRTNSSVDMRALTLLGNVYRQLGDLDKSEIVLREALDKESLHYFPLYGIARTLQSKGQYEEAAQAYEQAMAAGAAVARFDLGEVRYRQGRWQEARQLLETVRPSLNEPYRQLMVEYILWRLDTSRTLSPELLREGLPYWQESALRFRHTPYGAALADDISNMQEMMT